jgi:hypothetical protein
MEYPNAFLGQSAAPSAAEVSTALGLANTVWQELVDWLSEESGVEQEWKSSGKKYGWSLRLKIKKRNILYLSPCVGCFRAAFIFGDKAMVAARQSNLTESTLQLLDSAPRYPEGTGLRLLVQSTDDLAEIRKLARIKLAN